MSGHKVSKKPSILHRGSFSSLCITLPDGVLNMKLGLVLLLFLSVWVSMKNDDGVARGDESGKASLNYSFLFHRHWPNASLYMELMHINIVGRGAARETTGFISYINSPLN
jgi:hypothetical protein